MRALQYIIVTSVIFSIIAVAGFLVAREALLYFAKQSLQASLNELKRAQLNGMYYTQCITKGSQPLGDDIVIFQLRFISSTDYVLEAICDQFSFDPIIISKGSLPEMVTKAPGSSGFVMKAQVPSAVTLVAFEEFINELVRITAINLDILRTQKLYAFDDKQLVTGSETEFFSPGPVTNCSGYGFICCDSVTQVGVGEKIVGLNDCSEQCFARCIPRPVLLAFTSEPFVNPSNRTVKIRSGDQVDFSFLAEEASGGSLRVVIEFGDGARSEVPSYQGTVSHTYLCAQPSCTYTANIRAYDAWEIASSVTALSKITVIVE